MKKITFLSILFLLPLLFTSAQAQDSDGYGTVLGNEIAKATNGFIEKSNLDNPQESYLIQIGLPNDITFDEVRSHVRFVVEKYQDFDIQLPWERNEDEYVMLIRGDEEIYLLLSYFDTTEDKYLILNWEI